MANRRSVAPPSSDFGKTPATATSGEAASPLPGNLIEAFQRYVAAEVVKEIVDERAHISRAELQRACFDLWCEALWKHKTKLTSFILASTQHGQRDMEALFQVEEPATKNNRHAPEPAEGKTLHRAAVRSLTESGLSKEKAETFVANEVDVTPLKSLRPFHELFFGHYEEMEYKEATPEEKAVGAKLMEFVNALPPDERKLVLLTEPQVRVKEDMIARVTDYAEGVGEIKAIFKVFPPLPIVSMVKLGVSDTPEERLKRVKEAAVKIIDSSRPE
jgi:hypothetical protein